MCVAGIAEIEQKKPENSRIASNSGNRGWMVVKTRMKTSEGSKVFKVNIDSRAPLDTVGDK